MTPKQALQLAQMVAMHFPSARMSREQISFIAKKVEPWPVSVAGKAVELVCNQHESRGRGGIPDWPVFQKALSQERTRQDLARMERQSALPDPNNMPASREYIHDAIKGINLILEGKLTEHDVLTRLHQKHPAEGAKARKGNGEIYYENLRGRE